MVLYYLFLSLFQKHYYIVCDMKDENLLYSSLTREKNYTCGNANKTGTTKSKIQKIHPSLSVDTNIQPKRNNQK